MDEEDQKNRELLIVGQAFLHTGLSKVEALIQEYINASKQYHDSFSMALLNRIKKDIAKYRNDEEMDISESLKPNETSIYSYSGEIIKVFDKTSQFGFCVKKDYINNSVVQIQGICLDFHNSKIIDIDEEQCKQVEEIYCENDNDLYQLAIKRFNNRDYGNLLYEDIKNSFLVLKKDEVLER